MKRWLAVLAALLCFVLLLPCVSAAAVPADAWVARLEEAISASVGKDTPGAAVVTVRGGTRVMNEGFGYEDPAAGRLCTVETGFALGEISGLFVAAAALRLAADGALDLDTDVAQYLPQDFCRQLHLVRTLTVRDLLSGNSGFEGRTLETAYDKSKYRFDTLWDALLADVPAQSLPAETRLFVPSDFAITLAAYVVECASGKTYDAYVTEAVLTPLGMQRTVLAPTEETAVAMGFSAADGVFYEEKNGGRTYSVLYPANGAISCAADMALLLEWLLSQEKNDPVLPLIYKNQLFERFAAGDLFLCGGVVFSAAGNARYLRTDLAGGGVSLCLNTESRSAVLVLTNAPHSALLDLPRTLCGDAGTAPVLPEDDAQWPELRAFCGFYASATAEGRSFAGRYATTKNAVEIKEEKEAGTLLLGERHLMQIGRGVFAEESTPDTPVLRFLLDTHGNVTGFVQEGGDTFLPIKWYEGGVFATAALWVLAVLCGWFLLWGIVSLARFFGSRDENGKRKGTLLRPISVILLSLSVLPTLLAGYFGTIGAASFYRVFGVMALFAILFAAATHIIAFVLTLLSRAKHRQVVSDSILLIAFILLIFYWRLSYM